MHATRTTVRVIGVTAAIAVGLPARTVISAAAAVPDGAEVRVGPQASAPIVLVLPRGTQVSVSDQPIRGWRSLSLGEGRTGYLADAQIEVDAELVRRARPWILRPEVNLVVLGISSLLGEKADASSLALTMGRNLHDRFSLELTVGYWRSSIDRPPFVESDLAETSPGFTVMALGRAAPWLWESGRHALTLAGGPFAIAGGVYGPVNFAHAEIAYEYRHHSGVTALVGAGGNLALNDGRRSSEACGTRATWFCLTSVGTFDRGDVVSHFRFGLGWTFGS